MSRKRPIMPDVYKAKRRCVSSCSSSQVNGESSIETNGAIDTANDTRRALLSLRALFPVEKFDNRLPAIVLKHQIYSLVKNRTLVDRQLNDLRANREIKLFKLGPDATNQALVLSDDYRKHVIKVMTELKMDSLIIDKVIKNILDQCTDVIVEKEILIHTYCFTDADITTPDDNCWREAAIRQMYVVVVCIPQLYILGVTKTCCSNRATMRQLVKASILTARDMGSWWLSIPNAGFFMKSFNRGRKALITMIRKTKYKEILKRELEQRQWPKVARLGISYHIYDIMGADLVDCIDTNSGELLRLRE